MAAVAVGGLAWSLRRSPAPEERRVWDEAGIVGSETANFESYLLNVHAEVRNTQNLVNSPYTWRWRASNDDFSRVFADKLVTVANEIVRIVDGDNRPLPTRPPTHR